MGQTCLGRASPSVTAQETYGLNVQVSRASLLPEKAAFGPRARLFFYFCAELSPWPVPRMYPALHAAQLGGMFNLAVVLSMLKYD